MSKTLQTAGFKWMTADDLENWYLYNEFTDEDCISELA